MEKYLTLNFAGIPVQENDMGHEAKVYNIFTDIISCSIIWSGQLVEAESVTIYIRSISDVPRHLLLGVGGVLIN